MSLSIVKDQDVPSTLLRNMLSRQRIPNALLFWGPGGVGKRMMATEFAKAVACEAVLEDSCDECLSCRKIMKGNHPDLLTVSPTKKSRIIDVEAVNSMIEMASLRPYESQWRVFIIHDADRLGPAAQNHLLKTLEEPLGQSVFILLTEAPQFLLPTIRSRCQRVRFGRLKPSTVISILLREREISEDTAPAIAALAQGQASRALDLVDSDKRAVVLDVVKRLAEGEDPLALAEEFTQYLTQQKAAIESSIKETIDPQSQKELSKEDREQAKEELLALSDALLRRDILEHIYLFETWYRDALVYSATGDTRAVLNQDQRELLESTPSSNEENKLRALDKARLYLERFLNEERVFRDLFFALAS